MKRLLVVLLLALAVLAVTASPALAYLDAQAGGPDGAAHATVAAHQGGAGAATAGGRVAMVRGRGIHIATVPASHGGASVAIALLLAAVIGGAVYALATYRRRGPAKSAEPTRLPAFKSGADQKRKAA